MAEMETMERLARQAGRLLAGIPPAGKVADPELLADLLVHHELGAFASWRVNRQHAWQVALGEEAMGRLDATVMQTRIRRRMVVDALGDAMALFAPACRPVLFKGIALTPVYPEPHLREPGDLDIIVPRECFQAMDQRLQDEGWSLQPSVHRDRPPTVADRYGFARVYRHPRRPVTLDLHRAPIDRTEPFWIDPEPVLERTRQVRLPEGPVISVPRPDWHLALVALHAVRHGTFRLRWFLDVHLALEAWREELDRERFETLCREQRILRAVRTSLEITARLFHTASHPLDHLPMDRALQRAVQRRSPGVVAVGHLTRRGGWRRIGALRDLMDTRHGLRHYIFRTLFPPRELYETTRDGPLSRAEYWKKRLDAMASLFSGPGKA